MALPTSTPSIKVDKSKGTVSIVFSFRADQSQEYPQSKSSQKPGAKTANRLVASTGGFTVVDPETGLKTNIIATVPMVDE